MSQTMTAEEVFDSLTGFDEIAIAQKFGREVTELAEKSPTTWIRAMVFTVMRREGLSDVDAKQAALELTLAQTQEFFADDDEVTPDEPVTESGKDVDLPGEWPKTSQPSAS